MEFKRRGTLVMPSNPFNLNFKCKISEKLYTRNEKKYLDLELLDPTVKRIEEVHVASNEYLRSGKLMNPLEGNILKVKIPFRYKKPTCKIDGNKLLYELDKGDIVNVNIEYCGVWQVGEYCGPSWKVTMIISQ